MAKTRIPMPVKAAHTLFCAILIPVYWRTYGPANFLYFCDIALLGTLIGLWRENRLLISMESVAILGGQTLWIVDFLAIALAGRAPLGLAAYMFDPKLSLLVRGLSSFHLWLPFLLVYLLWRLGYDRRALAIQTLAGWATYLACYFLLPASININYVRGLGSAPPPLSPLLWLGVLLSVTPVLFYLPVHLVLTWLFAPRRELFAGVGGTGHSPTQTL